MASVWKAIGRHWRVLPGSCVIYTVRHDLWAFAWFVLGTFALIPLVVAVWKFAYDASERAIDAAVERGWIR